MMSDELTSHGPQSVLNALRVVGTHARTVWWATLSLAALGTLAVGVAGAVLLDSLLVLPGVVRLLLLTGTVAGLVVVLRWCWRHRPSGQSQALALAVEERYPDLDNLLINSLQLSGRNGQNRELVRALHEEAMTAVSRVQPRRAVSKRPLALAGGATALGLAAMVAYSLLMSDQFGKAIQRIFLPLGHNSYTRIVSVEPGDADVLIDSDVEVVVSLDARGHLPSQGELLCQLSDGRRVTQPLLPGSAAVPDQLIANLPGVQLSMRYRVVAGDDRSPWYELRTHRRPVPEKITQLITPPPYIETGTIEQTGGTVQALPGSSVRLEVVASHPLREALLTLADGSVHAMERSGAENGATATLAVTAAPSHYELELLSTEGFSSGKSRYDILPMTDKSPAVRIVQPAGQTTLQVTDAVVVEVEAEDDYALRRVSVVQLRGGSEEKAAAPTVRASWDVATSREPRATRSVTLRIADLVSDDPDEPIVLQSLAWDRRADAPPGVSAPVTIQLASVASQAQDAATQAQRLALAQLIQKQKQNIAAGEALLAGRQTDPLATQVSRQESIRADAMALAGDSGQATARRVRTLADTLMVLAVEQLRQAQQSAGLAQVLTAAVSTEREILKRLIAADVSQDQELAAAAQRQIAQALAELIALQKALREETAAASTGGAALSARQRALARSLASLQKQIADEAQNGAGGNPELAQAYVRAGEMLQQRDVRGRMLTVASDLADDKLADTLSSQDQVIADLSAVHDLLLKQAMAKAKEELQEYTEHLEDAAKRLEKIEKLQQKVVEIAAQLEKTRDLTEGDRSAAEHLQADLERMRELVKEAIEQLANDLHLFPDPVASNDLIAEMAEVYEDVKQQEGSENDTPGEVAVDRDEGVLAALKAAQEKMEERVGDLEMWLTDRPDSTKWNQESFDKNEMGQIPLGDLPDALEDIVGDMLKQAEELKQESQDSASNVGSPDPLVGWDIMDGPMPSWGAKGKSGNMPPNDNEQTGRSGSGRQGKSDGEIVGDTIKALEGSEVEARRTNDAAQAGELKEEDPGKMDVKATGGGKLAGTSDSEGFAGDAPPRDELRYRDMARQVMDLKRNAQSVYSKARLLHLPTGELDRAVLELETASRRLEMGDAVGFAQAQQRIARALADTQARLTGKTVVASTSTQSEQTIGAVKEPIPPQYEPSVAEYMRRIAQ